MPEGCSPGQRTPGKSLELGRWAPPLQVVLSLPSLLQAEEMLGRCWAHALPLSCPCPAGLVRLCSTLLPCRYQHCRAPEGQRGDIRLAAGLAPLCL